MTEGKEKKQENALAGFFRHGIRLRWWKRLPES